MYKITRLFLFTGTLNVRNLWFRAQSSVMQSYATLYDEMNIREFYMKKLIRLIRKEIYLYLYTNIFIIYL